MVDDRKTSGIGCSKRIIHMRAPNSALILFRLENIDRRDKVRFVLRAGTDAPTFKQDDIDMAGMAHPIALRQPIVQCLAEARDQCLPSAGQIIQYREAEFDIVRSRHSARPKQRVNIPSQSRPRLRRQIEIVQPDDDRR
ncbi:hypothetical protein [Sphingobium limneticum]|nr:hypothetical protein [Sphingobium limneticum]